MSQNKAAGEGSENAFALMWSPEIMLKFLRMLKEQGNLFKRSDIGWKPEAWNECSDPVQQVYTSTGQILVDKLKSNY